MTAAPAFLTLSVASPDEVSQIDSLTSRLAAFGAANDEAEAHYEGTQTTRQFGISIPPSMQQLEAVAGWGGTCVDTLEERLDWLGWSSDGDHFGLPEIYRDNGLDVDSGMAHLDSLIFGTSFVAVGSGYDGEPSPLVTPHSPQAMTARWDARTRRLSSALALTPDEDGNQEATLYLPNETITFYRASGTGMWTVQDRDQHRIGRVLVAQMPNRIRTSREYGRSEITRAVRYYTAAAVRTMLGLEVNREFYNAPARLGLNVDPEAFEDADGKPVDAWTAVQGRWNMIPPNDSPDAPEPKVIQFDPASPAPYLDQVRGYAQLLAAEVGIPAAYLGFATDNPASADAIRAGEARLVKRAERRQAVFGRAWLEVGRLALLVRDGSVPDDYRQVRADWRDAATPTKAATADAASKMLESFDGLKNTEVALDLYGLDPSLRDRAAAMLRRGRATANLQALTAATDAQQG